ncbi:MAG: PaaI family thioesterase [Bacteroidales bacterium]|nr:PaaI family thioesterase [Bacteroidales bacterium]
MREINNPYTTLDGYNCFGCSPNNSIGLQLRFFEDGEYVRSEWLPKPHLSGYKNILHGGIQATLLDEIASWTVQVKLRTAGVTANLDLRYKKPVYVDQGKIFLQARVKSVERNIAHVEVELLNDNREICCLGMIKYFTYPQEVARTKLYYPEFGKFFTDSDKTSGTDCQNHPK